MPIAPDPYSELLGAIRLDPWADRASCKGQPLILENPNETPAKTMCAYCPVIRQCTDWVLGLTPRQDPGGIRAGMNVMQRNRARRQRLRAANEAKRAQAEPPAPKPCRTCGDTKPASEFYRNPGNKDGLNTNCGACHRDAARERRLNARTQQGAAA
jgi:hypothetical protein